MADHKSRSQGTIRAITSFHLWRKDIDHLREVAGVGNMSALVTRMLREHLHEYEAEKETSDDWERDVRNSCAKKRKKKR